VRKGSPNQAAAQTRGPEMYRRGGFGRKAGRQEGGEAGRRGGGAETDLNRRRDGAKAWRKGSEKGGAGSEELGGGAGRLRPVLPHYGFFRAANQRTKERPPGEWRARRNPRALAAPFWAAHAKKSLSAVGLGTLEKDSRTFDEFREHRA
jgi:hypothetical protein